MLRILHTSDWHLGLELAGHDRLPEQQLFLDWLLATCQERVVDALLVCGDIYDTANPSVAAQELFGRFLARFRQELPQATVIVVAGNHDSGVRLELPCPFTSVLGGIHIRGTVSQTPSDHLIPIADRSGETAAWCLAVPFLRPADIACRIQGDETPEAAFARSVETFYRSVREAIPQEKRALPIVTMGHLTLSGSARAGSERLLIGGVESVPAAAVAEGAAYVALGHIHRAQRVVTDSVRYCGTPYPVDFDEAAQDHAVLAVELAPGAEPSIVPVPVPQAVPLLRFGKGSPSWEVLEEDVRGHDWSPWRDTPSDLRPLVELRYDGIFPSTELRERCAALCRELPLRLCGSPRAAERSEAAVSSHKAHTDLHDRNAPMELLERLWSSESNGKRPPEAVRRRFEEVLGELAIQGKSP